MRVISPLLYWYSVIKSDSFISEKTKTSKSSVSNSANNTRILTLKLKGGILQNSRGKRFLYHIDCKSENFYFSDNIKLYEFCSCLDRYCFYVSIYFYSQQQNNEREDLFYVFWIRGAMTQKWQIKRKLPLKFYFIFNKWYGFYLYKKYDAYHQNVCASGV